MSNTKNKIAKPSTDGISGKIAVLERRIGYLRGKLERPGYDSTPSADFDRMEVSAIEAAIDCMRYTLGAP